MSDLLDLLDEATEPDRRRAGDFSWTRDYTTRGPGVRACCLWCRREARWDHIKTWCSGTWRPRPAGPCMAQHLYSNQVRSYAIRYRDQPTEQHRAWLNERATLARAAQVDVDAILTAAGVTP